MCLVLLLAGARMKPPNPPDKRQTYPLIVPHPLLMHFADKQKRIKKQRIALVLIE